MFIGVDFVEVCFDGFLGFFCIYSKVRRNGFRRGGFEECVERL